MSAEQFVTDFVARLRAKAGDLRAYGAEGPAAACERNAQDLEDTWRAWWLADLTVAQVAARFGRDPSTVRGWISQGRLIGALLRLVRTGRLRVEATDHELDRLAAAPIAVGGE